MESASSAASSTSTPKATRTPGVGSTKGDGNTGGMGKGKGCKLYLYAWCGVSQDQLDPTMKPDDNNDFVATIDASPESPTFGQVLSIANSPYAGTQPHHCNIDNSGKYLAAGGLLSLLKPNTPDIFVFDVSDADKPFYKYGLTTSMGACPDEFVGARSGGFYASSMCSRTGGPGGGLVRLRQPGGRHPKLVEYNGGLSVQDQTNFTSHGFDIDYESRRIVSADYIVVASTVIQDPQPPLGLQTTVHVWDLDTMKVIKIIDLSDISLGLMESRFTGTKGLFWVSGGLGNFHLVDALTYQVTPNVFCVTEGCTPVPDKGLTSAIFKSRNGPRMLISTFALSQVHLVDVTDPYKLKTLDIYQLPHDAGGHVVRYNKEANMAAVATYFLNVTGTFVRFPSDRTVRLFTIDLRNDKIIPLHNGVVNFTTAVPSKGASDCHGLAFKVGE